MVLFFVSLLACGTANISWGRVLAMKYFITFYSFSYICFLPISFSLSYFIYSFSLFSVPAWVGLYRVVG